MKKASCFLLALLILCGSFFACSTDSPEDNGDGSSSAYGDVSDTEENEAQTALTYFDASLYADHRCGNDDSSLITPYTLKYPSSSAYDPVLLSELLTELTGYNFAVNSYSIAENGSYTVDWAATGSLFGNSDDLPSDIFKLHDYDSLAWFILDSMATTVKNNFGCPYVYYTMDGGKELKLPELKLVQSFPSDVPYLGSPFYVHQYGNTESGDFEMPAELSASLSEIDAVFDSVIGENISRFYRYNGTENVDGVECYLVTAYSESGDIFENLGMIAMKVGGGAFYLYDVITDSYNPINTD